MQITNIISTAIASISFDDESKTVSVAFTSNPEKVYIYTVSSGFDVIKNVTKKITETKASGDSTVSLGRYYNALINTDVLQLWQTAA